MPDHSLFRLRILPWCIALAMSGSYSSVWAEDDIQFDSRFLELKGDTKIDLKRFSSQGYVEPGKYNLQVQLNKQPLAEEYDIYWYAGEDEASKSYACLTPELVAQFGLKEDVAKNLQWSHDAKCLKSGQLEGMEIKADLSQSALVISLPQAYLEYTYPDWDPPSRWDDGISGIVADYSINAQTRHEENGGDDSNEISGNGTVGVNLGPWRMRADWQTNYQHTRSNDDDDEFSGDETQKKWEWSRYYAWRALPSLKAKLALGEDYLRSDIFDGFNYVGGSVSTDDQMLPPNLRGYAPDISGVAHTTAKVTVSQMGRVIYETQVPAGPFRIQDLGDSVSGTLHIRIEEQNGQVQEYDISTASMPYLTRPGQVRYKIMMGRPQEWGHHVEGEFFSGAEASWGIANGWSLYGGALGDENYQSAALGVGRDLSTFGAVAFDVTHSHTKLDKDTAYGKGSLAQVDLSANYHEGQYTSAGLSLQGGATLTAHGGALHRTQNMGGTRLLIDADGVADVPVEGNGAAVYTNMFGKAVVSDVNNYYRNQAYIDLNKLPENAEATQSVVQATLTEGAIGYRKFAVISGQKAMAVLRLQDGSHPPFGAEVKNDNEQTVGLVDDDGNVYLAGVKPGEHMSVFWSGVAHCDINLPDPLPADLFNGLLLPCQHKGNVAPVVPDDIKPVIQEQTQQVTPTNPPVSVSANQ
ncbi:TPA: fimbria/pilus outer membrane usher protein [Escherichia coli]|nr:fimbria/pilus outer membrane usher protein [Escherichia coli]